MHDQAFTILEYPALLALVKRGAQTPMGRARAEALSPLDDIALLRKALEALTECIQLRKRGVVWTFSELEDPAQRIALLRIEGVGLEPSAILALSVLCEQAMSARASILAERDASPVLWTLVEKIPTELNRLNAHIANKILPSGEIDDRASPELSRIRHEITILRSRIARTLENVMRRSGEAIQDELVTLRNDRFVIPVKSDHRARVAGVAHGYSSSGATAFVEPLETIDANNELQALHEEEAREIAKILFALTEELRAQLPGIAAAATAITELDFINAKAIFQQRFACVIPEIEVAQTSVGASQARDQATSKLLLADARHPLLEENLRAVGGAVVPVSFSLDDENNTMVISGANAGGKTVVLKTAGLLSLMALSGLAVPAREARVPFYRSVLADIGDHQSLAANLSTFTSHIANISRMIGLCKAPALVLLDEVGTGTDPEEGSALGVAVVDHFRKACGAQVMATTHYSGLKMYAGNEAGVLNASVEFDEKTLQPTYRLIVGVAGSSSGLEIARRFGIPNKVIDLALESVKDATRQAVEYLRRIKREAEEAESLRAALEEERAAVAEKFATLDKTAERHERERQEVFQKALDTTVREFEKRSREFVATIQDRSERLKVDREAQRRVSELKREAQRATSAGDKREALSGAAASTSGRGVRVMRDGLVVKKEKEFEEVPTTEDEYKPAAQGQIAVGDKVKLRSFGSIGIVDSLKGDEAEVRVKSLRFREKLENLERVELSSPAKSKTEKFASLRQSAGTELHLKAAQENGRSELNVIGRTTDEAVDAVDKFLDEASLASLSQVRIIHGHGTGALRRVITELLKDHPHVARFTAAPQEQGGSGATLVELRQ
ncbi:MAG: mismatch repair protein MutS2 [Pyrinomonadaceae bacterium]|jgi:DNA mismatch repair protein MutS2|nr:mismatch repair protein MutS2 [Pyrinomonadaceae bacterium]